MTGVKSQSGQALIESILVLVVTVAIVLGGLYQLNSAFKVWAEGYFGIYLTCLLESGELPGLGAGQDVNSQCRELYREFSLAQGQPLVGEGIGEGGGAPGEGPGNGEGGGRTAAKPTGSSEAGAVASNRFQANRFGQASRFRSRSSGSGAGAEGEGIDRQGSESGGLVTEGYSTSRGGSKRVALRETTKRSLGKRYAEEKDKGDKKSKAKNVTGQSQVSGPKLVKINRTPSQASKAPEIEEYGFGDFLRYLIIAAIVIAIVIFIGGQALQVSKSIE